MAWSCFYFPSIFIIYRLQCWKENTILDCSIKLCFLCLSHMHIESPVFSDCTDGYKHKKGSCYKLSKNFLLMMFKIYAIRFFSCCEKKNSHSRKGKYVWLLWVCSQRIMQKAILTWVGQCRCVSHWEMKWSLLFALLKWSKSFVYNSGHLTPSMKAMLVA